MTRKTKIGILIGTNIIVTAGLITALAIAPTRNNSNHSNSGTTTSETRKIEVKAKVSVDLSKKIDQLSNPSTEWFDFNGKAIQERVVKLTGKYDSKTQILTLEFELLDTKTSKSQHFTAQIKVENSVGGGTSTSETRKIEVKAKASVDLSKKIDQLSNPSTEWFDFNGKSSQERVTNLIGKYDSKTQILTLEFDLLDIKTSKSQHFTAQIKVENSGGGGTTTGDYVYDKSNNYYSSLEGLRGVDLFNALLNLQKQKRSKLTNYADLVNRIYRNAFIDKYFEKDNTILDVYSENPNGKDPYVFKVDEYDGRGGKSTGKSYGNGEGSMFNREHMIPQSWFNKDEATRCDAHFVWPTDKNVNAWRGNDPHDNISSPSWTSLNGTKGKDGVGCEPIDYFKGDIARAYFYFNVTHHNGTHNKGERVYTSTFPFFVKHYLDVYSKWATNDQVDLIEIDRNNKLDEIYGGLRNPFIDYPDLIELIWGNDTTKKFENRGVIVSVKTP
ncbi:Extracellular ribonuclease precursor (plasmid) [Mesomycoplasma conjunctivae]|nr:endonuclease [Mycoplasmopsis fermentans]ADV34305.1 Hypothetical Protein MfeM64YM_0301 [Mycoplasmopsis fermentans M64]VEU60329.1 Extracellular ribonuclease precursor [Mycoplasmopsis fermentans]VEU67471.1 Extracellular ribonuclease precursor [Mesomycoplasma conjunctivae]